MQIASKIIASLGGIEAVADIAGVDRTRVYRWTYPKARGGTGGTIPQRHWPALLSAAAGRGIPLTVGDFVPAIAIPPTNAPTQQGE